MSYNKFILILIALPMFGLGSTIEKPDSVLASIFAMVADTNKVKAMNAYAFDTYRENTQKSTEISMKALVLAKELKFIKGQIKSHNIIGIGNLLKNEYYAAENSFLKAYHLADSISDTNNISKAINNLGALAVRRGDYEKAINYNLRALTICQQNNDALGIARCFTNIGINHKEVKNYELGLEYFRKGIIVADSINNVQILSTCLAGIGTIYEKLGKFEVSNKYHFKSINLYKQVNDNYGLAITYGAIGTNYINLNLLDSSLFYIEKSNHFAEILGYEMQAMANFELLAQIHYKKQSYSSAKQYALKSLQYAEKINAKRDIISASETLAKIYVALKNFEQAYYYIDLSKLYTDSLLSSEKRDLIIELDTKYSSEQKQREIEILHKDQLLKQEQLNAQGQLLKYHRLQFVIIFVILFSVIVVAYIFQRNYLHKKRSNEQLTLQRNTIAQQNKKITDSIVYAQHIQEAILPDITRIREILPNSFLFFKPRDIVSGDFFWIKKRNNKILLAVVDCTGHGVSGAFMSILGTQLLNEIEDFDQNPADLLDLMREKLKIAMKQSDYFTSQRDGMDIALCSIDTVKRTLQYSGANIHLLQYKHKEIIRIKANSQPVAIYLKESSFKNHIIHYTNTDKFYLSTDGFSDQYGGKNNEKFKSKFFIELLKDTAETDFPMQKQKIHAAFLKYKGENEQIDDVTVFGFQCP